MSHRPENGKKSLTYLDFDLEIERSLGDDGYKVSVLRSPEGEAEEEMIFPFSQVELESRLKDIKIALLRSANEHRLALSPEEIAVKDFGKALFNAVMTGHIGALYSSSQAKAAAMQKGLRLKLRVKPVELAAIPWEFMYDPRQEEFICLSSNTPLVRYIDVPRAVPPISVVRPLKILGMLVSPADQPALNLEREKLRLDKAIEKLQEAGLVELKWIEGKTWRDLQREIRQDTWHIFHFIGHGAYDRNADEGQICLEDEHGNTYRMGATQLSRALADATSLRLVILNACEGASGGQADIFSSTASILVRRGIPAVLAMQYEISDKAAIEFSCNFYEALADGMPVDAATGEARKAIGFAMRRSLEWVTPVLFMRLQDGKLFDIDDAITMPIDVRKQREIWENEQAEREKLEREKAILIARQKADEERKAREKSETEKAIIEQRMKMARERSTLKGQVAPVPKEPAPVPQKQLIPGWLIMGPFLLVVLSFFVFGPSILPKILFPAAPTQAEPITQFLAGGPNETPILGPSPEPSVKVIEWGVPVTLAPGQIPTSAEDVARFYFEQINQRNYNLTWSLLSNAYKAKTNPEGFAQYKAFWDEYTVTVLSVKTLALSPNITRVSLETVFSRDGKDLSQSLFYYLNNQNSEGIWMFDVKPIFGSSADSVCASVLRLLTVGNMAKVATAKVPLLLRDSPSESGVPLDRLQPGTIITIVDGPSCLPYRDVYFWWWKARNAAGKTGWIVEGSDSDDAIFIEPWP